MEISAGFFDEMYLNTPWDYHYSSLDGRTILDRLASVKYFAVKRNGYGYIPYGYDRRGCLQPKKYRIYEDEDSLPLGYTYDSWISREKYEKLSVTEKQQALAAGSSCGKQQPSGNSTFPLMTRKQILHWKQEKAVRSKMERSL